MPNKKMMLLIRFLIIILLIDKIFSINREIIVILGCSINQIQNDRVHVGLEYIKRSKVPNVLFLTGGNKYNIKQKNNEATIMQKQIEDNNIRDITIIIDDKAKNTAENFLNLREWVNKNHKFDIYEYVIVTSDYHKRRASLIFDGIFRNIEPKWILSKSECKKCWNEEKIHIDNVESDIENALKSKSFCN